MNYYSRCWKKYSDFGGRARRKEYWTFTLFNFLIHVVSLSIIEAVNNEYDYSLISILWILFWLSTLIPSFAVTTRRLHDIGKNGWWQLLFFIPVIGVAISLMFLLENSDLEENKYGKNPKEDSLDVC